MYILISVTIEFGLMTCKVYNTIRLASVQFVSFDVNIYYFYVIINLHIIPINKCIGFPFVVHT